MACPWSAIATRFSGRIPRSIERCLSSHRSRPARFSIVWPWRSASLTSSSVLPSMYGPLTTHRLSLSEPLSPVARATHRYRLGASVVKHRQCRTDVAIDRHLTSTRSAVSNRRIGSQDPFFCKGCRLSVVDRVDSGQSLFASLSSPCQFFTCWFVCVRLEYERDACTVGFFGRIILQPRETERGRAKGCCALRATSLPNIPTRMRSRAYPLCHRIRSRRSNGYLTFRPESVGYRFKTGQPE